MNYPIYEFSSRIFHSNPDAVFYIFTAYLTACFIAVLAGKRYAPWTFVKICVTYFFTAASGLFLLISAYLSVKSLSLIIFFYCFFYSAVCFLFFAIISAVPKKADIEEESELIELIDKEIDREDIPYEKPIQKIKTEREERQTLPEIDFSHVKNVINRLDYYKLSPLDKRQVSDLKEAVYLAETEGVTDQYREKINDGLGNLLKIMSKHGV